MAVPWYLRPDGGRSATITKAPRKVVVPKPKSIRINRQPDGGLYPGGQYSKIKIAAPKKTTISTASPKLAIPKYSTSTSSGGVSSMPGGIQLPGASGSSAIANIYRRTEAQLKQMASEAVHLEADPQIKTLQHGYNVENQNYGALINSLRKQLGLSKGDIKGLYDSLDISLANNAAKQDSINKDTKTKMGAIYDDLSNQVGANYSKAQASTSAELGRLGIQQPQANDRLTADEAFLKGQASQSKANSSTLMDAINASTQGMMQGLRGGNAATSAMLQSGLQQQFDSSSADAMKTHLQKLGEINVQLNSIKSSLPSKINQTYAALLDQQYQREMDAAQKLFDNQIKLGNFQTSQQNAQETASYHQNQLALDAARLAQSSKPKTPTAKPLTGMDKALSYVQQVATKSHIPYSQLEALLVDAINGGDGPDYPGFNKNYVGRYGVDIKNATAARGYPQLYTDMIRAMNYWFQ